ncbi:MAG: hypothetical protein V1676_02005 [Candidatus Diapherotrites archaeon]
MDRRMLIATAAVIVLIAASLAVIYSDLTGSHYDYSVTSEGVEFLSNGMPPADYISSFSEGDYFIVSPEFKGERAGQQMVDALTLFSTVLRANRKNVAIVARVVDSAGNLTKCQTNRGDLKTSEEITSEECAGMLSDAGYVVIYIGVPDASLPNTRAVFSEGKIEIFPKEGSDAPHASLAVLKSMFGNAEEVISKSNDLFGRLTG